MFHPGSKSFAVSRGADEGALESAFESLLELLRVGDAALIVELSDAESPPCATGRSSVYALLDDGSLSEGALLRRLTQQEDAVFFSQSEGGLLHPHLDRPIQPQRYEQCEGGGQQSDCAVTAAMERCVEQLLEQVKPLTSSQLVSESGWRQSMSCLHRSAAAASQEPQPSASSSNLQLTVTVACNCVWRVVRGQRCVPLLLAWRACCLRVLLLRAIVWRRPHSTWTVE